MVWPPWETCPDGITILIVQTKADRWLDHQPLWLYSAIMFAAAFGIWTASTYIAARLSGGIRAGDAGFTHGHGTFSFTAAFISATMWTVIWIGVRWLRRGRKAIAWVLIEPFSSLM